MKTIFAFLFLIISFSNANDKVLHNDITLGYGDSPEDFNLYRISLKKDLNKYFFDNDNKFLPKYYESSLGFWKADDGSSLISLSFSPVFRAYLFTKYKIKAYVEAGLGATYISKTKLQNENFGIHFQFETLLGIGMKINNLDLTYRMMHYSNLLHDHNSGADFNFFSISYTF